MADRTVDRGQLQGRLTELDGLLQQADAFEPAAREKTAEIVQTLLDVHGAGLAAILDHLVQAGESGRAIFQSLADDELVAPLLLLHGLHPVDLRTRVLGALEQVRPYLRSHGGNVELIGVSEDGVVRLRLEGSCHGCPSSQATLRNTIEEAIYEAAADVSGIEVEGAVEEAPPAQRRDGFVPLSQLTHNRSSPPTGAAVAWPA